MRTAFSKSISPWAPATAMVMYCMTPAAQALDPDWMQTHEVISQRTATTAFDIPTVLPRTASLLQTPGQNATASEDPQDDSPWKEPLAELRDNLHATVSQLAEALGVSRQSVHAWQRGNKMPSAAHQIRITQLQAAAARLRNTLGNRTPTFLNSSIGRSDESFWDLLASGEQADVAASLLLEFANASLKRRQDLEAALDGLLGEPLDGRV